MSFLFVILGSVFFVCCLRYSVTANSAFFFCSMANLHQLCQCTACTMPHKNFSNQSRHVCVTLFRWDGAPADYSFDDETVRYAVWQKEKCEKTGKEHLQMYIEANRPFRLNGWKEVVGEQSAHIEVRKGSREQARAYCMKQETRVEGPWEFGTWETKQGQRNDIASSLRVALTRIDEVGLETFKEEDMASFIMHQAHIRTYLAEKRSQDVRNRKRKFFEVNGLLQWQQIVLEEIERQLDQDEGNDRKIIWVWEPVGNVGKSKFLDYLRLYKNAAELGGKTDAAKFVYEGEPVVCFDVARTKQEFADGLYGFAEELKNGRFLSSKYMSSFKEFLPPVVVFFANFAPPEGKWSSDRLVEFALHSMSVLAVL